jgi:hypothetical protein
MKKILLTFMLFSFAATMFANGKDVLSVLMKDGTSVYFLLAEKPYITFQNDEMKIVSDTDEALVKRTLVERFEFVNEIPAGIEDVEEQDEQLRANFKLDGDAVYITGLASGSKVVLYAMDGRVVNSSVAAADGCVTLSLNTLPSGIYIVKYNDTAIKFIKS